MRCSQAQRLISDYIDGLLKKSKAKELERHMQQCMECSNLFVEMKSLVGEARDLKEVQPSDDVWISIKEHMTTRERKSPSQRDRKREISSFFRYPQGLAIASGAFLAIIIFTFLLYYGLPFSKKGSNDPARYALQHFEEAERHYQLAIDALVSTMPDYKEKLPPDLAAVFKENLAIIDNSIRVCQAAIQKHPGDKTANALLMACYRKKIELLNEIRDLAMRAG
jgi:hypothetical protein